MTKFKNGKEITQELVEKFCKDKASEITPDIYLGNYVSANNKEHLQEIGITHIIRIGTKLKDYHQKTFKYLSIDLEDDKDQIIYHFFHIVYDFIEKCKYYKGKVFVHCKAGISRSATLVMSYLMKKNNIDTQVALKMVEKGREIIWPNSGFIEQLDEFYIKEIANHTKTTIKGKYRCYTTYNCHKKGKSFIKVGISKPEVGKHTLKKINTKFPRRDKLFLEEHKIKLYKELEKEFQKCRESSKSEIKKELEHVVGHPVKLIKEWTNTDTIMNTATTKQRQKKLSNLIIREGKKMIDDIMNKERVPLVKVKPLFNWT
jgi:predicted protein tyrosine phosphatase